jgi:hypothetical protein
MFNTSLSMTIAEFDIIIDTLDELLIFVKLKGFGKEQHPVPYFEQKTLEFGNSSLDSHPKMRKRRN